MGSNSKVEVDVIRRVYEVGSGPAHLEIGPWPDGPSFVELRTADAKSKEYFGPINVSMSPDFAEAIGKALIAAAAEARSIK